MRAGPRNRNAWRDQAYDFLDYYYDRDHQPEREEHYEKMNTTTKRPYRKPGPKYTIPKPPPRKNVAQPLYKPMNLTLQNNQLTTEMKTTFAADTLSVNNSGTMITLLDNLVRGDGVVDNFIGGAINPTAIKLRYNVANTIPSAITTARLRQIVFQWFDAAVPVTLGVLETTSVLSPVSWTNRPNIKILSDRLLMGNVTVSGANYIFPDVNDGVLYIKGKNLMPISFPRGSVIPQKGGLYMLVISDTDHTVPSNLAYDYYVEVDFTDK